MNTLFDMTESKLLDADNALAYMGRLISALGDPSQYEYRGEWYEDKSGNSRCACNHPIVQCFPIHHKHNGTTKIIGSTCIEHFATINPTMAQAMADKRDEIAEQLKEAERKAKLAVQDENNARQWATYDELRKRVNDRARAYRNRSERIPYPLYCFAVKGDKYNRPFAPKYQRACDLARWLKTAIATCEGLLA